MAARSHAENELLALAAQVFPGGVIARHRLPDERALVFSHGRGAHLWDMSGREYIDYTCGGGALILGYDAPEIRHAVAAQMEKAAAFISIAAEEPVRYAADLVATVPVGGQIRFCNSGAEGTFFAMRLARAFTGRDKILKFEGAYHGNHDYALWSYGSSEQPPFPTPARETAGIPRGIDDLILVGPYNDSETLAAIARRHSHEIASIIVEPAMRLIAPRPGFLQAIRALCTELGIVMVMDETVTGFRHALGGAQERYSVMPDLAVYGKSLGGGLPLAAVAGRAEIMRLADTRLRGRDAQAVFFSGTTYGNPVACAAGRAMLEVLRRPGMYLTFHARCDRLKRGLTEVCSRLAVPGQVIGEGPMWHLVFSEDEITDFRSSLHEDRERLIAFHHGLLDAGIFVRPGGGHYFTMAHTDADVDFTVEASEAILKRIF
jgi:glutamate-1-semialdehyde 2,1-aminomutase